MIRQDEIRDIVGDQTILRQSGDSHVQKYNPCMIRSRYGRCMEYSNRVRVKVYCHMCRRRIVREFR